MKICSLIGIVVIAAAASSNAQSLRLDLDAMKPNSAEGDTERVLDLPTLDLYFGSERDGLAEVSAGASFKSQPGADGRHDSPYGRYRIVSLVEGTATRQPDGSRRVEIGAQIEVLSETYKVPSQYVITLVTTTDSGAVGDVVIEGARIDPKDPEGQRRLDPFRIVLPSPPPE